MPTDIYHCSKCTYSGTKFNSIKHFLISHVPDNQVPYVCNVCSFKALTEGKWNNHSQTILAMLHEIHSCTVSSCPYRVTVGAGKDIFKKILNETSHENQAVKINTKPKKLSLDELEKEENFIPDYDEIVDEKVVEEVIEDRLL